MSKLNLALKKPDCVFECEECGKKQEAYKGMFVGLQNEYYLCSDECERNF